jgi:hypothetical protein
VQLVYRGLVARPLGRAEEGLDEGVSHRGLLPALLGANVFLMLLPPLVSVLVLAGFLR